MNDTFRIDTDRIRDAGWKFRVNEPLYAGSRRLVLSGPQFLEIADLNWVAEHEEVHLVGSRGGYYALDAEQLANKPQVPIGVHAGSGYPIVLGLDEALAAHISVFGGTQSYKSVTTSSIAYVLGRQRTGMMVLAHKTTEPALLGAVKAAALQTGAPFSFFSLKEGEASCGLSLLPALGVNREAWRIAEEFARAADLNIRGDDRGQDYYGSAVKAVLEHTLPGCPNFIELLERIRREQKKDRELGRATARLSNMVQTLARIPALNLAPDDPRNTDLRAFIRNRGILYCSVGALDAGHVGTLVGGLIFTVCGSLKREIFPGRGEKFVTFIDESQHMAPQLLENSIAQFSSEGLVIANVQHDLSQYGPQWESKSMPRVRIFCNTVSGSLTSEHLQLLFGTHIDYLGSEATGIADGVSEGSGESSGTTVLSRDSSTATSESCQRSRGTSHTSHHTRSRTQRETLRFGENEILALKYRENLMVVHPTPGAGLTQYGEGAILVDRAGLQLDFEFLNRVAAEELADTHNKLSSAASLPRPAEIVTATTSTQEKRQAWLEVFEETAARVCAELSGGRA